MKKIPKEQHKKRVLIFIEPEIIQALTKENCQSISKEAIKKGYRKLLKTKVDFVNTNELNKRNPIA
jgi:hypothetical protein